MIMLPVEIERLARLVAGHSGMNAPLLFRGNDFSETDVLTCA